MRVQLTDPELVYDLRQYLRQADCIAVRTGKATLEAYPRAPVEPDKARRELGSHLIRWQLAHPQAAAYLLD